HVSADRVAGDPAGRHIPRQLDLWLYLRRCADRHKLDRHSYSTLAMPDLVVASITPNATSVMQGASFGFSYVIQNIGAGAAGMSWAGIFLDQQTTTLPMGWNQIGALNANASATATNSFSTAGITAGQHTLWVEADYWNSATNMANSGDNDVVESDE